MKRRREDDGETMSARKVLNRALDQLEAIQRSAHEMDAVLTDFLLDEGFRAWLDAADPVLKERFRKARIQNLTALNHE